MFGKKKAPKQPFALQALTTEFLIEGTAAGNQALYFPVSASNSLYERPLALTSVRIQTTQAVEIPPRSCSQFMVHGDTTVALVPQVAFDELANHDTLKALTTPIAGLFYFGPYLIRGSVMMSNPLGSGGNFSRNMPMFDVHITSGIPGTRWGEIRAPFALVNGQWLLGYEPQ